MRDGDPGSDPGVMDMRCMIIDDNVGFQYGIRSMLERDGASVVGQASNGHDAVERAAACRPDVVLVDVRLGSENGFDIAHRVEQRAAATPDWRPMIILISTHTQDEVADRIAANPSFAFLDKTTLSASQIRELHAVWTGRAPERSEPNVR